MATLQKPFGDYVWVVRFSTTDCCRHSFLKESPSRVSCPWESWSTTLQFLLMIVQVPLSRCMSDMCVAVCSFRQIHIRTGIHRGRLPSAIRKHKEITRFGIIKRSTSGFIRFTPCILGDNFYCYHLLPGVSHNFLSSSDHSGRLVSGANHVTPGAACQEPWVFWFIVDSNYQEFRWEAAWKATSLPMKNGKMGSWSFKLWLQWVYTGEILKLRILA